MLAYTDLEIQKHLLSFDLSKQTWVAGKSPKNVPFAEADITTFMLTVLPGIGEEDIFKVTIRKYPQNYFIAFEFEAYDFYGGEDFTHDGDGAGVVPLMGAVTRVFKVAHAEFERNQQYYLSHLLNRIVESVDRGAS